MIVRMLVALALLASLVGSGTLGAWWPVPVVHAEEDDGGEGD